MATSLAGFIGPATLLKPAGWGEDVEIKKRALVSFSGQNGRRCVGAARDVRVCVPRDTFLGLPTLTVYPICRLCDGAIKPESSK